MEKKTGLQLKRGYAMLRALIYLIMLALLIGAIFVKRSSILESRGKEILSIYSEWKEKGIPVNSFKVKKENFKIYKMTTAELKSPLVLKALVTSQFLEELKSGQDIIAYRGDISVKGKLTKISKQRDLSDGLFPLEFSLENKLEGLKTNKVFVKIHTGTFNNVLTVPNEAIVEKDGSKFVYKIDGSKADKTKVSTGFSDGLKTIISSGLKENTQIVLEGNRDLKDTAKVMIYKCKNCS